MLLMDRFQWCRGVAASFLAVVPPANSFDKPLAFPTKASFHAPPPGVEYAENDTVFGQILRGELAAHVQYESEEILAFRDKYPRAPLHALVIPKRRIDSVRTLSPEDVDLIEQFKTAALDILDREQPKALSQDDYLLVFHIPPFYSVKHLHLHVLAPASEMGYWYRDWKFSSETIWCTSVDDVISRLKQGTSAV